LLRKADYIDMDYNINKKGVTLMEVLVVLVIIGISAAIAVPSLAPWMAAKRMNSATRGLAMDFNLARNQAIRNAVQVNIGLNNATSGSNWYAVYYAVNGTTTYVVPQKPLSSEIAFENINFTGSGAVAYNPRGMPLNTGSFDLVSSKAPDASKRRTITVKIGGSVVITP